MLFIRSICIALSVFLSQTAYSQAPSAVKNGRLSDERFSVEYDVRDGTLLHLAKSDDAGHLEFLRMPVSRGGLDESVRHLGEVFVSYRAADAEWQSQATWKSLSTADENRRVTVDPTGKWLDSTSSPAQQPAGEPKPILIDERFSLERNGLIWRIRIRNLTSRSIQVGDLGFPLPFNTDFGNDHNAEAIYTKHVLRHASIAGSNSFVYWLRPDGASSLEYEDLSGTRSRHEYVVYAHAMAQARDKQPNGTWNQPLSDIVLAPSGQSGSIHEVSTFG